MDSVMLFWGLVVIAVAIYSGLHAIALAIRYRHTEVSFSEPIRIVAEGKNDGAPS